MIRFLFGDNFFARNLALKKYVDEYMSSHGKLVLENIDASEADINTILASVKSLTLFDDKKMVVINDLSKNKQATEQLSEIIESVDENVDVILVEGKLDKRASYYKTLKKQKNFEEFSELDQVGLINWVIGFVDLNNGSISRSDASYLVDRVGLSQSLIEKELSKLLDYESKITKKTIDEMTVVNPKTTIFNLIDAVFSGNLAQALKIYDEQRAQKVEPQAIIGMLVWQMHIVSVCLTAKTSNMKQLSAETGINSYVLGKSKNIADKMGRIKVQNFLGLLRDIEIKSKSQTYDLDDALKYAISSLK